MKLNLSNSTAAAVVLSATLSVASCLDMTEVPREEITEANFHPTADDAVALIAPAYTPLRSIWMGWFGMVDHQAETADMLLTPARPDPGRRVRNDVSQ